MSTYSRTKRLVRTLLGPNARVLERGGEIYIVTEEKGLRTVYGCGANYVLAVANSFLPSGGRDRSETARAQLESLVNPLHQNTALDFDPPPPSE